MLVHSVTSGVGALDSVIGVGAFSGCCHSFSDLELLVLVRSVTVAVRLSLVVKSYFGK